jgi:hypothetical protein
MVFSKIEFGLLRYSQVADQAVISRVRNGSEARAGARREHEWKSVVQDGVRKNAEGRFDLTLRQEPILEVHEPENARGGYFSPAHCLQPQGERLWRSAVPGAWGGAAAQANSPPWRQPSIERNRRCRSDADQGRMDACLTERRGRPLSRAQQSPNRGKRDDDGAKPRRRAAR